jgi:hypothetical protein
MPTPGIRIIGTLGKSFANANPLRLGWNPGTRTTGTN